jgi:hypothetical protein
MEQSQPRREWQFSLRSFMLAAVLLGLLAGVLGPKLAQAWRVWQPPAARPILPPAATSAEHRESDDGYFESGETPLY